MIISITTQEQVADLRKSITQNAEHSLAKLRTYTNTMDALHFFATVKFDKIGADPINGRSLNLIEQINQMYSDLVALAAVRYLLTCYPNQIFELHLGATAGYDIQSNDGQVIAECFAATSVTSNDKLNKDCRKLENTHAEHKYLFFYSHMDSEVVLQNRFHKYPNIHFKRFDHSDL